MKDVNENIDLALKYLYAEKNYCGSWYHFPGYNNVKYMGNDKRYLAEVIESKGLIQVTGELCRLTEPGIMVCEFGGYLEYVKADRLYRNGEDGKTVINAINSTVAVGDNNSQSIILPSKIKTTHPTSTPKQIDIISFIKWIATIVSSVIAAYIVYKLKWY